MRDEGRAALESAWLCSNLVRLESLQCIVEIRLVRNTTYSDNRDTDQ